MYLEYRTGTFQNKNDSGNSYDRFLIKCRRNIVHFSSLFFFIFSLCHFSWFAFYLHEMTFRFACVTVFFIFYCIVCGGKSLKSGNINDSTSLFVFWAGGTYISRNASECAKVSLKTLKQHQYMLSKRLRKEMRAFKGFDHARTCNNTTA